MISGLSVDRTLNRFLDGFSFVGGSLCSIYLKQLSFARRDMCAQNNICIFFYIFFFLSWFHEGISFIIISLIGEVLFGACFLLPH
jgi:hypothetical protein